MKTREKGFASAYPGRVPGNALAIMKRTRYIIVGYSRSGTTVVHQAVMGHPDVAALNDELKVVPFFTKGISTFTFGNDASEEKERGHDTLFDALTLMRGNSDTRAHGLKVTCMLPKRAKALVDTLQRHMDGVKIVLILRKDLVAQFGSALMARRTGIYHSWHKKFGDTRVRRIKINKFNFIAYALLVFETNKKLKELSATHDTLEVHYEDLLEDSQEVYKNIFEFLNIQRLNPTWIESRKVLPMPEEYIKNYANMKSLLERLEKGTIPYYIIFVSKIIAKLYESLKKARNVVRFYRDERHA